MWAKGGRVEGSKVLCHLAAWYLGEPSMSYGHGFSDLTILAHQLVMLSHIMARWQCQRAVTEPLLRVYVGSFLFFSPHISIFL